MDHQDAGLPPPGQERFVAFLDLLGFKTLVEAAEHDPLEFTRLRDVLLSLSETLCNNPSTDSRFTYFSDCIIITTNTTADALWDLFQGVHTLTGNLLQEDVFVRGAITRGWAFHDERYVYGTAVSRAVELEARAEYPLTLLSPEVCEAAKGDGRGIVHWIERDSDDRHFLHYLENFAMYHRLPKLAGTVSLDSDARRIRFNLSRRLLNDSGKVLEKAKWFQAYWNRTVASAEGFMSIEADASLTAPEGPKTRIARRLVLG